MFAACLVGAPLLYRLIGMDGLFALTGLLSLAAIWLVKAQVPDPPPPARAAGTPGGVMATLRNAELLRLNAGIFILHIVLYAMFVVVPLVLVARGLEPAEHWKLYLPVVLGSFVLMVPAVLYADRHDRSKPVLLGAIALLLAVEAVLGAVGASIGALAVLMLGFFVAFNVLEAMLPSLVSRIAPAQARGVAIGVYNTTQTLGVFFGGWLGGWLAAHHGAPGVFLMCAVLAALWLAVALGMRPVRRQVNELSSLTLSIPSGVNLEGLRDALARVPGVHEAEVLAHDRVARIKVVPGQWDESRVRKLVTGEI